VNACAERVRAAASGSKMHQQPEPCPGRRPD
jgi:hypothetical protein